MAFRFLHLADLHLDTVFGGLPETRDHFREATFRAFERAVDFAIREQLHAVLAAGDLYDDELLSLRTEVWFREQVQRLAEAGVSFLACCGNHDPGGENHKAARLGITLDRAGNAAANDWRRRVHLFRDPQPEVVRVHDRSGAEVAIVVGAGHPTAAEANDLAATFPTVESTLPVVGLLHSQVAGARAADLHDRYAPSTAADYERSDYSYWALGHVHVRGRAVPNRPVYYAGNLQGRNPRETGAKGGYLVEAHAGAPADPTFIAFAPARWERFEFDDLPQTEVAGALTDRLVARIASERAGADGAFALRCVLAGPTPLAMRLRSEEARSELEAVLATRTGALEVQLRTARLTLPFDRSVLRDTPTVVATALELIAAAREDAALLGELAPAALLKSCESDSERDAYLAALLDGIDEELIQRSLAEDRT
jgi:DNA repair exonuclease SbcCD nuclease subunit